jgi:hypothetical protein
MKVKEKTRKKEMMKEKRWIVARKKSKMRMDITSSMI